MTKYREILRLKSIGLNHTQIAESAGISRPTVITVLQKATETGVNYQRATELSDKELANILFPSEESKVSYKMPDYEYVHREIQKSGVTLQLLWFEYCDKCRETNEIAYQLTQFKKYYRDFIVKHNATMHINRKPGELLEVDWAGQTAEIIDTDTGEVIEAYIFVAVLPYSGYAYVEAFSSQNAEAWITAHINAYNFVGGITKIVVPDNLKTGIIKNTRTELIVNQNYQEMAEHYGTAIIPARVRKPKDKSTVEGTVGIISTYILAAIRNQRFFSLRELNEAIKERLYSFNHKPFQNKNGSRASAFTEERTFLLPLPARVFEPAEWKIATVQYNYHINVEDKFYSVPYEYIRQKVNIRITRNVVEVFFEGNRICSHIRITNPKEQYRTIEVHMPPNHQQYIQWNAGRFREWAGKIGVNTVAVIETIITGYKVEQQSYKSCMAVLKLSDTYTPERLESACAKALSYTPKPNYKNIQSILKSGQDKVSEGSSADYGKNEFGFTRGADYYKGGKK
jgi:Transposase and inactivated derivatives